MTAIDKLRRLLDETGVEWHDDGYATTCTAWSSNGITWYGLWRDGSIELLAHQLTPAQAIAATVGRGTCYAYETEPMSCSCNDVQLYNGKWVTGLSLTVHVMKCSACGGTYEYVNGGYEYCPRCGRKRVSE